MPEMPYGSALGGERHGAEIMLHSLCSARRRSRRHLRAAMQFGGVVMVVLCAIALRASSFFYSGNVLKRWHIARVLVVSAETMVAESKVAHIIRSSRTARTRFGGRVRH